MPTPIPSRACWIAAPGRAEIRAETLAPPAAGEVQVRALHGAISRGTEALVFRGEVPESEFGRMRAPFQQGDFPAPVKYGYINVGRVEAGAPEWVGRTVFCLYPHQTRYVVPADAVLPLPAGVPPARAVLAANMETAVNALWDGAPRIGDRIAVVGGGVVGLLVAALAARLPGCIVEVIDPLPAKRAIAEALGARAAPPEAASPDADRVFHASGHPDGLATALAIAGFEARVVEMSWYGTRRVTLPLGEGFHARRLAIVSSQVGHVAPAQRSRWSHRRRLALALELLAEPAFDRLVNESSAFDDLPRTLERLAAAPGDVLCHRIDYPDGG